MLLLQLKYFLAVAKYEHITKAAEQLHIAQPSLSQSMRRLEKELGVSLFEHRSRNIVLSEAGKRLVEMITPVIEVMDSLPRRLKETEQNRKKTIHLNIRAASSIITDGIISYKMLHPDIHFQVSQNEDPDGCDLCITSQISAGSGERPETAMRPGECREERPVKKILEENFFLAVPAESPYARRTGINLAETAREGYIGMNNSKLIRTICERFCMTAGFTPQIIFESDVPSAVQNLIGAGLGVGFWPEYTWGGGQSPCGGFLSLHCGLRQKTKVRQNSRPGGSAKPCLREGKKKGRGLYAGASDQFFVGERIQKYFGSGGAHDHRSMPESALQCGGQDVHWAH